MRILHFSDVHVTVPINDLPKRELLGKRFVGLGNLVLRRRTKFKDAPSKLLELAAFMRKQSIDLVINTGDYTALGTSPELALARQSMEPFRHVPLGMITMPGNHDVYLRDALLDRRFETHFGEFLRTDRADLAVDGVWPMVRLFDEIAVVCVNSARPNPEPWLSSGCIPDEQLAALARALADSEVRSRFVIVATHYAARLENGRPDSVRHGLDNGDALLDVCQSLDRGMLICGHVHHRYRVELPALYVPFFCAGSATYAGREGFWIYEISGGELRAMPGSFGADGYACFAENLEGRPQV